MHIGLGRILGPNDYGVFGIILTLITMTYIAMGNGVRQAVVKYVSDDNSIAGDIQSTGLLIQTIFCIVVGGFIALCSQWISSLLGDTSLSGLIRLSALLTLPTGLLFVYVGVLEGLRQFARSATVSIVYALSRILFVFSLVFLGLKVYGAVFGLFLSVIASACVAWHFCRALPKRKTFDASKLIRFGAPVLFFFIALAVLMNIDMLIAKVIVGTNERIGLYTSAQALSRFIYFVFTAFSVVLLPSISSAIASKEIGKLQEYVRQSLRYMIMLLMPISCIVCATSRELIVFFYGAAFSQGSAALSTLVFGISFLSILMALASILQGFGIPRVPLITLAVLIPVDISLLFILIPRLGLVGAALATTVTSFVGLIILGIFVYRLIGRLVDPLTILKVLLASLIIYGVALLLPAPTGPVLPLSYLALLGLFFAVLFLMKGIEKEDIFFVKRCLGIIDKND
jgi:O-antigen/teichoic acid export membrane protein